MAHWRKTYRQKLDIAGGTTMVVLQPSEYGWELRGFTYTMGNAKAGPEGNPYLLEVFADFAEAYEAFKIAAVLAVTEPYEYEEHPPRMVGARDQQEIHNAAKGDHPHEPEYA